MFFFSSRNYTRSTQLINQIIKQTSNMSQKCKALQQGFSGEQGGNIFRKKLDNIDFEKKNLHKHRLHQYAQRQAVEFWQINLILLHLLYNQQFVTIQLSTKGMRNQHTEEFQRTSAFRRIEPPQADFGLQDPSQYGVSNEMMQVINAQNVLIMKLLYHQNVLYRELNKKMQTSDSSLGTNDKRNVEIKVSGYRQLNNLEPFISSSNQPGANEPTNNVKIIQLSNKVITHPRPLKQVDFKGQIDSSPQQAHQNRNEKQKNIEKRKQTQTKNMVKNFAKAIFSYIRKNKQKRYRVLHVLGINQEQFMKVFQKYRGHIHSITELRSLWSIEGNPFHKAFRIFSADYLRKYCLQKTFNSRVENYLIHLKYRRRLLEALESPLDFTSLKTS